MKNNWNIIYKNPNIYNKLSYNIDSSNLEYWESAYFFSGGKSGPYTETDFSKPPQDIKNNEQNGADSSCGSSAGDTNQWIICNLNKPTDKYKYTDGYINAFKKEKDPCAINGDSQGKIILYDNDGKVATFQTGSRGYGSLNENSCSINMYWNWSIGEYTNKETPAYKTLIENYLKILNYTNSTKYIKQYIPQNKASWRNLPLNLITKAAFNDTNNLDLWNKLYYKGKPPANNGVNLAWGHGFYEGACGSTTFIKQQVPKDYEEKYPKGLNNVSLHVQTGTRAWSNEISDTKGGGNTVYMQEYLLDSDAATGKFPFNCMQLSTQKVDTQVVFDLLNHVVKNL